MKEIEITVNDFGETNELLQALGYRYRNYQENTRINYEGKGCVISIDTWPQIPTYLEIEANSVEDVLKCLKLIPSLQGKDRTSLSTQVVYKRYGIDLAEIKYLYLDK